MSKGIGILTRSCSNCKMKFPEEKAIKGKKCPYCLKIYCSKDRLYYKNYQYKE